MSLRFSYAWRAITAIDFMERTSLHRVLLLAEGSWIIGLLDRTLAESRLPYELISPQCQSNHRKTFCVAWNRPTHCGDGLTTRLFVSLVSIYCTAKTRYSIRCDCFIGLVKQCSACIGVLTEARDRYTVYSFSDHARRAALIGFESMSNLSVFPYSFPPKWQRKSFRFPLFAQCTFFLGSGLGFHQVLGWHLTVQQSCCNL